MPQSKDHKILELEQKIKLLEKQKAFLEKQVEHSDKKAIFFDMMIDMAEKEFNIPIRKTRYPNNQTIHKRKRDKYKFHLWIARV